MMKILYHLQRNTVAAFSLLSIAVLLSSCLKDSENNVVDIPAAGLMAFNLAPDQQSVAIRLSGSSLTQSPLSYTNFTGLYQRIYTGQRTVESFDYPESTPLASKPFNFEQDKLYSLFVVGYNDKYRNVITLDDVDSAKASSGKAFVRYINAVADSTVSTAVTFTEGGNSIISENATYASVSDFKEANPGEITVAVKNGENINASRNITLQQGRVYTVLLIGVPGETGDASKVQIKYVENGTVVDEQ